MATFVVMITSCALVEMQIEPLVIQVILQQMGLIVLYVLPVVSVLQAPSQSRVLLATHQFLVQQIVN